MIETFRRTFPADNKKKRRKIYVYLPTDYDVSRNRYPVLYMFDGQNVFFDEDATYGKSWGLDKYLDYTDTPLIVVAVECNTSEDNMRLSEYSPFDFQDQQYGNFVGMGERTIQWYIKVLKPLIDKHYRTIPDREHTLIAGSSMGGLMSLYAVLAHNDVFSRAAALSPSIWVDYAEIEKLAATSKLKHNTEIYMDYGSEEMRNHKKMLTSFADLTATLIKRNVRVSSRIVPHGYHTESSWEKQTPIFIQTIMYGLID